MSAICNGLDPSLHNSADHVISILDLNNLTRKPKGESGLSIRYGSDADTQVLWRRLLQTVHHPTVTDKHLTAACNAICFYLRSLTASADLKAREFACSDQVWTECFEVARSAFAASKTKPALQVLDTLAYLAKQQSNGGHRSMCISNAAAEIVRIIFTRRPRKSLKDACIILYFFLRKLSDFFSFSEVLDTVLLDTKPSFLHFCRISHILYEPVEGSTESSWMSLVISLLMMVPVADSKTAVLKLLALICTNPTKCDVNMVNLVQKAVALYGNSNISALEDITRDVLPSVITTKEQFYVFLPAADPQAIESATSVSLMLSQVKFGLLKTYISETELPSLLRDRFTIQDDHSDGTKNADFRIFTQLMSSADSGVRQNACDLLLTSITFTTTSCKAALISLLVSLPALHDDNDSFHRGEIYSMFRRFILRAYQRIAAFSGPSNTGFGAQVSLVDDFLARYIEFLAAELMPDISYSRHILALDLLCFAARTIQSSSTLSCFAAISNKELQTCLFRLILDPYNDVRQAATVLLTHLSKSAPSIFTSCVEQLRPLEKSRILASDTNRADHADGYGRLISLLCELPTDSNNVSIESRMHVGVSLPAQIKSLQIYVNNSDSYQVSSEYALHGVILGLSYSIRSLRYDPSEAEPSELQASLLPVCQNIWLLSQTHLCVDSPEIELDIDPEENGNIGPKDILAYAWRALRDSNTLMQTMLENTQTTDYMLKAVGDMCFEQLCLLRHRGAFSTVAQSFLLCCQKARAANSLDLVKGWFERALLELKSQANKLTRRSAGLPALFTALLDPQQYTDFAKQFDALVSIAEVEVPERDLHVPQDRIRLPQVHALNCIKDIMTNSRFRNMTEPLVMRTIHLAAKCMSSSIWAIKNCGLMLLRASINRLDPDTSLGASEGGLNLRKEFSEGQTPLDIAIFLLRSTNENSIPGYEDAYTESEFAGLDLLGRLYIEDTNLSRVRSIVLQKLGHQLWHIRAQAARLFVKLADVRDVLNLLASFSTRADQHLTINETHGRLLAIKEALSRTLSHEDVGILSQNLSRYLEVFAVPNNFNGNVFVYATCAQVANALTATEMNGHLKLNINNTMDTLCNEILSESAIHASLAEEVALHLLESCQRESPESVERAVMALERDDNIAINALRRASQQRITAGMMAVQMRILDSEPTDDVLACAMDAISVSLNDSIASAFFDIVIVCHAIKFDVPVSRKLYHSQLKLCSLLVSHTWSKNIIAQGEGLRQLGVGFCLHLWNAAHDEYEEPTRYAAVQSILNLTRNQDASNLPIDIFDHNGRAEILFSLYDLLNDDDEDIRQLATIATRRICSRDGDARGSIGLCNAYVSRQRLRKHLARELAEHDFLLYEYFRRVAGWNTGTSVRTVVLDLQRKSAAYSVQLAVERIVAASNDLFAEEKQNLYIDDFAETRVWAQLISTMTENMDSTLMCMMKEWSERGLQSLQLHLDRLERVGTICPDTALELLLVRTITVARLTNVDKSQLEYLKSKCQSASVSVSVLKALDWLL